MGSRQGRLLEFWRTHVTGRGGRVLQHLAHRLGREERAGAAALLRSVAETGSRLHGLRVRLIQRAERLRELQIQVEQIRIRPGAGASPEG